MLLLLAAFAVFLVLDLPTRASALPQSPYRPLKRDNTKIRGVNLGGWFVLEQWITPSLFPTSLTNRGAVDQWTWLDAIANNTISAQMLESHWSTFITEDDFQAIAAAGLNTVRIPIPHWTFNASSSEPYLGYQEQPYIAQALLWAQDNNLDVILDLHTAPGSQNGYENSGKEGPVDFATGTNASTNAARVLSALADINMRYIANTSYGGVVKMLEVVNEPLCSSIGQEYLTSFYEQAYSTLANISAKVLLHDCFVTNLSDWDSTFSNTSFWVPDTFAVDTHRYQAYSPQSDMSYTEHIDYTCKQEFSTQETHPFDVVVGEFSLSVGCTNSFSPAAGSCGGSNMTSAIAMLDRKEDNLFYRRFFEAQVSTYENATMGWIFWNWKTESYPTWSYQAAMAQGWIPASDPTDTVFKTKDGCPTSSLKEPFTFAASAATPSASRPGASIFFLTLGILFSACILHV
jgi:glucan 1,3-beta-glucosidase